MSALFGFGSPLVTLLWVISVVALLWWTLRQLLRRRLVSLLSILLLLGFFPSTILQYPFAFSPINAITIGQENFLRYRPYVDWAFLISTTGLVMLLLGYMAGGRRNSEFIPLTLVLSGIRAWSQSVFLQLSSIFILLLFGLLFGLGLLGAEGARNIAQSNPALRPFYNIAHVVLPLTIALNLFVGIQRRRRLILGLAVVNLALAALTGARAVAFGGLLTFALTLLVYASARQRLRVRTALTLIPLGALFLLAVVYLGDVREGQYNILRTIATLGLKLLYGNNFSDLRDFAWVRSYWDGEYFLGRTQLAGILSFIPSAISSYRAEWNWGVVTTTITGLDPLVTPGLRTGSFGEMYFNFGLPGVLVAGFGYGYLIRRVHNLIVMAARTLPKLDAQLSILAGLMTVNLAGSLLNTAGFFSVYITIAILGGLQLLDFMVRVTRDSTSGPMQRAASHALPS
jgi:hypothetical protein